MSHKRDRDIQLDLPKVEDQKPIIKKFKVNWPFLILYICSIAVNGICVSWTTGGANQTTPIFAAKLGWDAEQTRRNNTLINFFSQVGKAIGATYGGKIIPHGRKKAFMSFNVLSFIACLVMQILNVWTLCIGKFLHGIFVTVCHMAAVKMINETVPVFLLGQVGVVVQTSMAFGYCLVMGMGMGLPVDDYDPALSNAKNDAAKLLDQEDTFWRFLYIFPCFLNVWMLFNMFVFIKEDSIMFNLSKDDEEGAKRLIDKVYHKDEDRDEILQALKGQVQKKSAQQIPYCEALFSEKFIKATIVGCAITSLYQHSTVNVWNMFSNRIVTNINEGLKPDAQLASNFGTQVCGLFEFLGALSASYMVGHYPRRWLLTRGHLTMTILLFIFALGLFANAGYFSLFMMATINATIQVFLAGVHWVYIPEITNDTQFGFVTTIHYSAAVWLSATMEYQMAFMTAAGTFLYFAGVNFCGFLFMTKYVKETQGLTDKQKKRLYIPSQILKLTEGAPDSQGGEIQIDTLEEEVGNDVRPENFEDEEKAHKLELEEQENAELGDDYAPVEQCTNRTEVVGQMHDDDEGGQLEMEDDDSPAANSLELKRQAESMLTKEELIAKKKKELQALKLKMRNSQED